MSAADSAMKEETMRQFFSLAFCVCFFMGCNTRGQDAPKAPGATLLAQTGTVPLAGMTGRIDHFGLDAKTGRLFMAALGNDSVEVIDLKSRKVIDHIKGLQAPQGIAFGPESNRLAIANDKDGSCRLYDATSLKQVASVDLKDDADNVRYDAAAGLFWVGYGQGGLAAIDPVKAERVADVKLEGHPESFQLEAKGQRIFVNVPSAGQIAVIDRQKRQVITKWSIKEAAANFPMALDEPNKRLFVGCRRPSKLLAIDTDSGKTVASIDIVGDTDDVFYDAAHRRIYVSGGEGKVTVIRQKGPDSYKVLGAVDTAPGARTSYFVPDTGTLYVAVPHRGAQQAELRVFQMADAGKPQN
jgi:YVTN family beta-propeller protein